MSSKNDEILEKTEASNLQQLLSDEAEIVTEASDYGSTFQSFRLKDVDEPCLLETEEIDQKKMTTSNSLEEPSYQQPTMENEEISSEEAETDEVFENESSFGSFRSFTSLSVSEYIWPSCLEIEEIDQGFITFSRMSSSSSFLSSSAPSQPQVHPQSRRPNLLRRIFMSPRIEYPFFSKQKRSSHPATSLRPFSRVQLKMATYNYSIDIGIGLRSTVYLGSSPYLGMLEPTTIAVKKCWFTEKFLNKEYAIAMEMLIRSQINHVNVVKLLGFGIHVEMPILVLEYIPNGTLFDLIHQERDVPVGFPLDTRLRIASEAAKALAYLHHATSPQILHGHVKSSNILLDELYTAKLSCFGATFLELSSENVLGTPGYVDPEYLETGELTDKSDVYSFGVVLLELLTRKKAVYSSGKKGAKCNLSDHFFDCIIGNRLLDTLDNSITSEGLTEQLQKVTKLAARCLREKGAERPTMKEVHMELEASRRSATHPCVTDYTDDSKYMMILQTDQSKFQNEFIRSLCKDKKSDINMNERRDAKGDNMNGMISVGLWRYQTEYCFDEEQFDHCGYDGIKKIIIHSSYLEGKINSIRIQYTKHGQLEWTEKVGEDEGDLFEIVLDDPDEYIRNVTGYISSFAGLCSLTFFSSNQDKYGPFGIEGTLEETHRLDLIPFEYSGGKLVGFRGTIGSYISSIGFYLQSLPQSCEKYRSKDIVSTVSATEQVQQINVEVFGHFSSGMFFNHKEYEGIKRIFIGHERRINYFKVEYIKNGRTQLTDGVGDVDMEDRATEVIFDYPNEFLQGVTGSYFVTFYDYSVGIVSLTFHSNMRKYGPFGYECGQFFEVSGGEIVGFQGTASEDCLYSIGFHITPNKSPSPLCDLCESSDVLQENAK